MGNGAVVSSASVVGASSSYEWFNRSMRCCVEDDHVSLGTTWSQNFSKCPLDESQWGKLFATAAGRGALGCLEFLFQVWRFSHDEEVHCNPFDFFSPFSFLVLHTYLLFCMRLTTLSLAIDLFRLFFCYIAKRMECEASALKGASSSKKLQKLVGALTARAAAAAAQPEVLDLVREEVPLARRAFMSAT